MQAATWYTRFLLSVCTLLLLVIASELHTTNRLQADALRTAQMTAAPGGTAFGPVATALHLPSENAQPAEMRVRIVGYEYNGKPISLGTDYSYYAKGLPVIMK